MEKDVSSQMWISHKYLPLNNQKCISDSLGLFLTISVYTSQNKTDKSLTAWFLHCVKEGTNFKKYGALNAPVQKLYTYNHC